MDLEQGRSRMSRSMRTGEGENAQLFPQSGKSERIKWTPNEGLQCFSGARVELSPRDSSFGCVNPRQTLCFG